jgi:hypothetical protein
LSHCLGLRECRASDGIKTNKNAEQESKHGEILDAMHDAWMTDSMRYRNFCGSSLMTPSRPQRQCA